MASIGQPFIPWDALRGERIDAQIRPLVAALNHSGWVRTVFSCAGHPDEPDSLARGRRQAHVDVVVADLRRWRDFVRRCRRAAGQDLGAPGVRVRCVEGALGPVPDWLRPHLPPDGPPVAGSWWRRLLRRFGWGRPAGGWRYRRLVFEPVPYGAPPQATRAALDAALAAAVRALAVASGRPAEAGDRSLTSPG